MKNAIDSTSSSISREIFFPTKKKRDDNTVLLPTGSTAARRRSRKTHKDEIACSFYDPSIAFSGLFEKMESFAGLS